MKKHLLPPYEQPRSIWSLNLSGATARPPRLILSPSRPSIRNGALPRLERQQLPPYELLWSIRSLNLSGATARPPWLILSPSRPSIRNGALPRSERQRLLRQHPSRSPSPPAVSSVQTVVRAVSSVS